MTEQLISNFYLTIDGSQASATLIDAVEDLTVESSLHLPAMATVVIFDPTLVWADNALLTPGKALKVEAKAGQATKTLFEGEIVELELDFDDGSVRTIVRAFDKLHRLGRGSKARTFLNVTDSDVVREVAGDHGLSAQSTATAQVYPYILQQAESDLALLRRLAARNGHLLYVSGGTLHFAPPASAAGPTLIWGSNLRRFRPRFAASDKLAEVSVRGWDFKQKQEIVGRARGASQTPAVGEQLGKWSLPEATALVPDLRVPSQSVADELAAGLLGQHTSRLIEAEGEAAGDAGILAGVSVTLDGVGTRFAGSYTVTSATHRFSALDGYQVGFSVSGLNLSSLLATLAPAAPAAGFAGLMPAIVTNSNDPDGMGRVKVKLPWLGDAVESDWARVAAPGAGPTRGLLITPEVNDEVLVGFLQGDGDTLFVLGGLWNGKDKPPKPVGEVVKSGKVALRVLRTRVGHEIRISDDDSAPGITIVDKDGNEISIASQDGAITIKGKGDITIDSQKSIALKAAQNITLTASSGKVELKAPNVAVDASAQLQLKGNLGKLEASGPLEIKGAVIKLN